MAGKRGRPSSYSETVADTILERLALGESLKAICDDADLPHQATVFRWLQINTDFRERYTRAREAQADALFDELLTIADDGRNDWMEVHNEAGEVTGYRENGEAIRRSALRIDARKWMASKLMPKKYGDKIAHTGADGGPVALVHTIERRIVRPRD